MEIIFKNPFYLWALLVLPVIVIVHFISIKYSKRRAIKYTNFVALARASEKVRMPSNLLVLIIRMAAFTAIVLAIAGTTVYYTGSRIDADYVVAVDASASMLAEDFVPNRFEAAKNSASEFVDSLPFYSSVGVLSFSGISYVHQPLTSDRGLIKSAIAGQKILAAGGTSLGDAIIASSNLLISSGKPRVVVLITDGKSNIGIDLNSAIDYANRNNVIVNAIGIGTENEYFLDIERDSVSLGIDMEELNRISKFTGGKAYRPLSLDDLRAAYEDIASGEKTKASFDLSFLFLLFVLISLTIEWILINTRYNIIP